MSVLAVLNLSGLQNEPLVELLLLGDQVEARRARATLVARGSTALPTLIQAFKDARSDRDLWRVLTTISEIGGTEIVPHLIEALRSNNSAISSIAAQTLGSIKDTRAIDPLLELLNHRTRQTSAIWIIDALGKLGAKRAVNPLIHLLHTTNSVPERYTAIEALGIIGDQTVIGEIRRHETDPDDHVRDRVQTALARLYQRST